MLFGRGPVRTPVDPGSSFIRRPSCNVRRILLRSWAAIEHHSGRTAACAAHCVVIVETIAGTFVPGHAFASAARSYARPSTVRPLVRSYVWSTRAYVANGESGSGKTKRYRCIAATSSQTIPSRKPPSFEARRGRHCTGYQSDERTWIVSQMLERSADSRSRSENPTSELELFRFPVPRCLTIPSRAPQLIALLRSRRRMAGSSSTAC